jgi:ATP-dependent Zn protease
LPIIIIGVWIFYNEKNVSGGAGGEDKFFNIGKSKTSLTKNRC